MLYLEPTKDIIKDLSLDENGSVLPYFTSRCDYYMDDFVPFGKTGSLRGNKEFTKDTITYTTIYAHYIFEGKVMGPNVPIKNANGDIVKWISPKKPKKYTGKEITYHPEGTKRGAKWHEKMINIYMGDIVKEVEDFMKRGGAK